MPHLQIEIHVLHPPPSAESKAKGYWLPDFYSGATGIPGRFSEGLLLRRLHRSGAVRDGSRRLHAEQSESETAARRITDDGNRLQSKFNKTEIGRQGVIYGSWEGMFRS
jgi:hypothetical protein